MRDFHAKCMKLGRYSGLRNYRVAKHHRRHGLEKTLPGPLCLLAELKERRPRQRAPECPKQIEEMNKCARVKLELLIIDAWAIYFHFDAQTQCVYET